ncbi:hypothetical protein NTG1052_20007 [Candidatus Nitrotoga sp. 1052]|nr:hypothetical protein NTG1052_20007 [Candidatus Nitrotoga sp. 1052]
MEVRRRITHYCDVYSGLVYSYATGVFSCRKLENTTHDSVTFRFVAAEAYLVDGNFVMTCGR